MSNKFLLVVDMQNDFIDGSLGTNEAQAIVDDAVQKIRDFDGTVWFTQDTHGEDYLETAEGKSLPVEHCIKDTPGWEINPDIEAALDEKGARGFIKYTFGSTDLVESLVEENKKNPITSIEIFGLCTDICVVSNALMIKAHLPEVPIIVDSSVSAGVTPEKHEAALETMRSCQVQIV